MIEVLVSFQREKIPFSSFDQILCKISEPISFWSLTQALAPAWDLTMSIGGGGRQHMYLSYNGYTQILRFIGAVFENDCFSQIHIHLKM